MHLQNYPEKSVTTSVLIQTYNNVHLMGQIQRHLPNVDYKLTRYVEMPAISLGYGLLLHTQDFHDFGMASWTIVRSMK